MTLPGGTNVVFGLGMLVGLAAWIASDPCIGCGGLQMANNAAAAQIERETQMFVEWAVIGVSIVVSISAVMHWIFRPEPPEGGEPS